MATALYTKSCKVAWTGDGFGHEWHLGWSVYANEFTDDDQKPFVVYEDDGRGNGNYVGDFDVLDAANAAVDRLVERADGEALAISEDMRLRAIARRQESR